MFCLLLRFFLVVMEADLQQRRKVSVLAAAFRGSELHLLFENDSDAPRRLRINMKGFRCEITFKPLDSPFKSRMFRYSN